MDKFCVLLFLFPFFKEYEYSTDTDCFVVDSTRLHLIICLPFVINTCSSWQDSGQILNHQYGISVADRGTDVPPGETTPAERSKERELFFVHISYHFILL